MNSQDIYNLHEAYIGVYADLDEERAPGVKEYQPRKRNPLPKEKALSGEKGDGSGYGADKKFTQDTDAKSFKPGVDVPKVKQFGRISRIIPHGIGDHANKTQSRVSTIVRKDPGAPTSQKLPPQEKKKASKEIVRKTKNEEVDIYDIILSHLLDEGYADTYEAAEAIMVNMSEDWRESIVEDFPNVLNFPRQGGSRSGDAGTRGLTKTPTGYINRHSRGDDLPEPTVNKIMGGNLMVKNGTKKNTNSNIA